MQESTLRRARRYKKKLSRDLSERLYNLGRAVAAVRRTYHRDRDEIYTFMHLPHPSLDGMAPFDTARSSSAGADSVLNLVRSADAGMSL